MVEISKPLISRLAIVGTQRFIRVAQNGKQPIDSAWQKQENLRSPDNAELNAWIENGGNYGVVGGHGLIIIDADNSEIDQVCQTELPSTFTVQSPGSKMHHRYYRSNLSKPLRLKDKDGENIGDIQGEGKQVLGPGSIHPNGGTYQITNDQPLAYIDEQKIRSILDQWIIKESIIQQAIQAAQTEASAITLPISDVLNHYGIKLHTHGDELYGPHPIHGSTNGQNFWVNPAKNCWHCFPPNQNIVTPSGLKEIGDIKAGDTIIDGEKEAKITSSFKRFYDGDVLIFNSLYLPQFTVTPGHPFLVARCPLCNKPYESYISCKPNCPRRKKDGKHNCRGTGYPAIKWVNSDEINPNTDFLIVPKNYSPKEWDIDLVTEKKHGNYRVPDRIPLNEEVAFLIGTYIAEGHVSRDSRGYWKNIHFTLSYDEIEKAKYLQKTLRRFFNLKAQVYQHQNRGTTLVQAASTTLGRWLIKTIGNGSTNKKLGKYLNAPKNTLREIIDAYIDGDGHNRKNTNEWIINTVSKQLAYEVHLALIRLGEKPRIYYSTEENNSYAVHGRYIIAHTKNQKRYRHWEDTENLYVPIIEIKTQKYAGIVCNLETETHQYQTPQVSHNCFRCSSGGGPLSLIAMREGIIQCSQATKGALRGDIFLKTLKRGQELGLIEKQQTPILINGKKITYNPEDFFTKKDDGTIKTFIPQRLANKIQEQHKFASIDKYSNIYYYDETKGTWYPRGEILIRGLAYLLLDRLAKRYYIEETLALIRDTNYVPREKLDHDINRLPLENGVLNINTLEIEPFSHAYYALTHIPIKYDPEATCHKILKFIQEICPHDQETLQEWIGYHLLRDYRYQKCVQLIGEGNNGKSTFLRLLETFLGKDNVSNATLYELVSGRFAKADLYGKLANIASDISPDELKRTGAFKAFTGGDYVRAELKHQNAFKFLNYAKLTFSANRLPPTPDESDAFFRRWILISFPNTFEPPNCDPTIIDKITTPQELSGLLNWAIQGLRRLKQKGEFTNSQSTENLRQTWRLLSNPINGFLKEYTVDDVNGVTPKTHLYTAYCHFCKQKKIPPMAQRKFTTTLKDQKPMLGDSKPKIDGKRMECWTGISLNRSVMSDMSVSNILFKSKIDQNHFKKVKNSQTSQTSRTDQAPIEEKPSLQETMEQVLIALKTFDKPVSERAVQMKTEIPSEEIHHILELLERDKVVFRNMANQWRAVI